MKTPVALFLFLFIVITVNSQDITKDTVKLKEVIVTGTKIEVARDNVPLSISTIKSIDLEENDKTSLLPSISENVPGLFVTERGIAGFGLSDGSAGQINIRGLGGNPTNQILILIDGHPQFMGLMGCHLPDSYVATDASRVEVIRGPASIMYGSHAMSGVINIITKKQEKEGISANGKIMYGSFNSQKYLAGIGFKKGNLNIYTNINHEKTDGHRDSSDFKITNGYLKTSYAINKNLEVTADLSLSKYEASDPGMETDIAGERIDIFRGRTTFTIKNKYSFTEGELKLYNNFGEHKITDGWHSNDEFYGIIFYQGIKLREKTTITTGYDYMNMGGKANNTMSAFDNNWINSDNHAVYAMIQQNILSKITVNAGIRYEINSTFGNEWIPQTGFTYKPLPFSIIKGTLSKGYRPPSIRELYFFPPSNEALQPENIVNTDLGWSQYWLDEKMKTDITGFIITGDNLILFTSPPPQYMNTGKINNKGIEFEWSYKPIKSLNFNMNYTYINMQEPQLATPEHNAFFKARYTWKKLHCHLKVQHIRNLYNQDLSREIRIVQSNYTLLGAKINYNVNKFADIFISGENLLNEEYEMSFSYPMPGTAFFIGCNIKFNK